MTSALPGVSSLPDVRPPSSQEPTLTVNPSVDTCPPTDAFSGDPCPTPPCPLSAVTRVNTFPLAEHTGGFSAHMAPGTKAALTASTSTGNDGLRDEVSAVSACDRQGSAVGRVLTVGGTSRACWGMAGPLFLPRWPYEHLGD